MLVGIMLILSMLPAYQERLETTELMLSVAISAYILSRIVFQTPIGIISDRYGRRKLILTGMFMNALIVYLLGNVADVSSLIALRTLQGISMASVETPLLALAVDIAGERKISSRVSTITSAQSAGLAVGPLLGGIFGGYVNFRTPFYISSTLILISAVVMWIVLRKKNYC